MMNSPKSRKEELPTSETFLSTQWGCPLFGPGYLWTPAHYKPTRSPLNPFFSDSDGVVTAESGDPCEPSPGVPPQTVPESCAPHTVPLFPQGFGDCAKCAKFLRSRKTCAAFSSAFKAFGECSCFATLSQDRNIHQKFSLILCHIVCSDMIKSACFPPYCSLSFGAFLRVCTTS